MSSPDAVCVSGYLSVCISGVTYVLLLRLQPHTWGGGSAGLHLRSHLQLCSWPLGSLACVLCALHTRVRAWGVDGGGAACLLLSDLLWALSSAAWTFRVSVHSSPPCLCWLHCAFYS